MDQHHLKLLSILLYSGGGALVIIALVVYTFSTSDTVINWETNDDTYDDTILPSFQVSRTLIIHSVCLRKLRK